MQGSRRAKVFSPVSTVSTVSAVLAVLAVLAVPVSWAIRAVRVIRDIAWLGALAALAASASSAWAGPGAGTDGGASACRLQTETIPVQMTQYRLIAIVKINGRNQPMMVNTSSEYSVLFPKAASALGLTLRPLPPDLDIIGNGRKQPAQRTTVRRLKSGTLALKDVDFVVADIDTGLTLAGVIGRDILAARDMELDISRGVIRLVAAEGDCGRADLAYWAGATPVNELSLSDPEGPDDRRLRIPVSLNGTSFVATLGSGAQFSSLLPETAHAAGIPDRDLRPLVAADGVAAQVAELDLRIGAERFSRQPLEVEPFDAQGEFDLMLSVDYLLSHRIHVSYTQRKLYATRNGFPAFQNRAGYPAGGPDAQAVDKSLEALAQEPEVWAREGLFHFRFKRLRESIDAMDRAIALNPGEADFYLTRARARYALDDHAGAGKDAEEALRRNPALDDARMIRAGVRVLEGQREKGIQDLTLLDSRLPADADIRYEMAWLFGKAGRATEAIRQWTLWIDGHPEDVELAHGHNERCFLRTTRNVELPLALQDCERATALRPSSAAFQDSLGWTRLRMGDLAGARSAFDAAIRLEADLAWSLYGRSLAWAKAGDASRARADLEAARRSRSDIDRRVKESGLPDHEGAV